MNLCICQYWPVNLWMDRRDPSVRQVLAKCTRYSPVLPGRVMQGGLLCPPLLCLGMKELDLKMIKTPFVLNDTDKVSHSASPTCCHLQWWGQSAGYYYVVDKTSLDRTWGMLTCWHPRSRLSGTFIIFPRVQRWRSKCAKHSKMFIWGVPPRINI